MFETFDFILVTTPTDFGYWLQSEFTRQYDGPMEIQNNETDYKEWLNIIRTNLFPPNPDEFFFHYRYVMVGSSIFTFDLSHEGLVQWSHDGEEYVGVSLELLTKEELDEIGIEKIAERILPGPPLGTGKNYDDLLEIEIRRLNENQIHAICEIGLITSKGFLEYVVRVQNEIIRVYEPNIGSYIQILDKKSGGSRVKLLELSGEDTGKISRKLPSKGKSTGPTKKTLRLIRELWDTRIFNLLSEENILNSKVYIPPLNQACKEKGITAKTVRKYAPNLCIHWKDTVYDWDWEKEDKLWEVNNSKEN